MAIYGKADRDRGRRYSYLELDGATLHTVSVRLVPNQRLEHSETFPDLDGRNVYHKSV